MFAEEFHVIQFCSLIYHTRKCQILQDKKLWLFAISQNG